MGDIDIVKGLTVAIASLLGVYLGVWLKDLVSAKNHKKYLIIMYIIALLILIKKIFLG